MYNKIILICGMPRSGTSWLGQIFDSSPDVAFRMEPLFSYRFKNIINDRSSLEDILNFFTNVYLTNDDFIHQKKTRQEGVYCFFKKSPMPKFLVVKTTRHHHLLKRYLKLNDRIEVVSIIRHPCAVISSWINTEHEFIKKGCVVENDWRTGQCRKDDNGEFWGFNDWLTVTHQHVELSRTYKNFSLIKYTDLVHGSENLISNLFDHLSIQYTKQTMNFLEDCHSRHHDNPYSVFKRTGVEHKWKTKLNTNIAQEIIDKTISSGLEEFIK